MKWWTERGIINDRPFDTPEGREVGENSVWKFSSVKGSTGNDRKV